MANFPGKKITSPTPKKPGATPGAPKIKLPAIKPTQPVRKRVAPPVKPGITGPRRNAIRAGRAGKGV